jgi:DNA polymerase elongation subunit (family B)
MYKSCGRDGIISDKIGSKGVLLARRDNSPFVRNVYENVVKMISNNEQQDDILNYIIVEINKLCSNSYPYTDFIVTKSVGSIGNLTPEPFTNEKGVLKAKIGDYSVPILSNDPEERKNQLLKKEADNEDEYYLLCLPAQVQLAERMRRRGLRVENGSRLEYIVTETGGHTAKQYEKVESADYFAKYREILRIDTLYYLKNLSNPIDQLIHAAFGIEDFVLSQYNYRYKIRQKVIDNIKSFTKPKIIFIDE